MDAADLGLERHQLAVIDFLYERCELVDFSEFLIEQFDWRFGELAEALEAREGSTANALLWTNHTNRAVLDEWVEDPDEVLSPSVQHKAYAGLKKLLLYCADEFRLSEPLIKHLSIMCANSEHPYTTRHEFIRDALQNVIEEVLLNGEETPDRPYSSAQHWQPDPNSPTICVLDRQLIWRSVQEFLFGGVKGITARLSDVVLRAEQVIELALLECLLAEAHESPKYLNTAVLQLVRDEDDEVG